VAQSASVTGYRCPTRYVSFQYDYPHTCFVSLDILPRSFPGGSEAAQHQDRNLQSARMPPTQEVRTAISVPKYSQFSPCPRLALFLEASISLILFSWCHYLRCLQFTNLINLLLNAVTLCQRGEAKWHASLALIMQEDGDLGLSAGGLVELNKFAVCEAPVRTVAMGVSWSVLSPT
jgi:hypothetical protein